MASEHATDNAVREAWENVRSGLRNELGDATFNSWLKSMALVERSGSQVTIACQHALSVTGSRRTMLNAF